MPSSLHACNPQLLLSSMHYIDLYDRTCGKWVVACLSPVTVITLYLLWYGKRERFVPKFIQQYMLVEDRKSEEDCVKISLSKNLEQCLRKLARENLITVVEDADENDVRFGKSFYGIRMVQIDFKKMTAFKKEMKKFYDSEKKEIFQSQNTDFPRCNDSDIKYIFQESSSFVPKIMEYFGFYNKKKVKRFIVGSECQFLSTTKQYIKL